MRDGAVDAALVIDVERGSDQVHERGTELAKRTNDTFTVVYGSGVAAGHRDRRSEVQLVADGPLRWDRAEPDDGPKLVRRIADEVSVEVQDIGGVLRPPVDRPGNDRWANRVQREPERADDAEVPAAASQRPEQVGVLVGRRSDDVALRGDHLGVHEVVDGEPVLAHEPADAAAEAEAADAGVAHDASRRGQAVGLGLVVDVAPQGATLHVGRAFGGVDRNGAHRGEVDDDPVVAHRRAGHVVAPAAYRDLEVAVAGEPHGCRHVSGPGASGEESGSPVDHAVPHGSGVVVVSMLGSDQLAPEPGDVQFGHRAARLADSFTGRCCHHSSSTADRPSAPSVNTAEKSAIWTSK
ncbi:MAG TPA: hypothetical protein VFR13_12930 [Jiangellaceae bacterium]|nr:hypothetical protein [Jiangellaceae bacterium]